MNRIREMRIAAKMTQQELGDKIGLNQTAVGKYERGELEPSISTLKKLSALFECSIDYLLLNADDFGNVTVQATAPALSAAERELIADFRALSPDLQEMLQATIQTWKKTSASSTRKNNRA